MVVTDELREVCAWIAARSTVVRVVEDRIPAFARDLGPPPSVAPTTRQPPGAPWAAREAEAAYWLTLDAINFGSGWFPSLRKQREPTGYRTIASVYSQAAFEEEGRWTAAQLTGLD